MFLADSFRAVLAALEGAPDIPAWTLALKAKLAADIVTHPEYFTHVVLPAAKTTVVEAGTPLLPMIPPEQTKRDAVHRMFWGLFFDNWTPQGTTSVFLSDLADRGPDNRRKKLFASAMTPDRYDSCFKAKVDAFHAAILAPTNIGKPFTGPYLDAFVDLYWDLHLGLAPDAIPPEMREVYDSFVTVFALRDPVSPEFYHHYMNVRRLRPVLMGWIRQRILDLPSRPGHERTFVAAWLEAGKADDSLTADEIAFECFTDFLAMSQWPQAAYMIAQALDAHPDWQALVDEAGTDRARLRPLVLELFRLLCPNEASFSPVLNQGVVAKRFDLEIISAVPHRATSTDPRLWRAPETCDPGRFAAAPTSDAVDEAHVRRAGLAACPFPPAPIPVDGRPGLQMTNSAWGTVFGVKDGVPMPVCDHAGFAPFGFGYRRCPGELLTLAVFTDFLAELNGRGLMLADLKQPAPRTVVVGPVKPVPDRFGVIRRVVLPAAAPIAEPAHG